MLTRFVKRVDGPISMPYILSLAMANSSPEALVVGAGPVGLTMAAELARHGVSCRIVDQLASPLPYCRAIGVTPRTLEVWDDMGVATTMIDAGLWIDKTCRYLNHSHARPFTQQGILEYLAAFA
jgi:2-polyprenyl-6-methoxyphenol hydroxylase-like FAD-dependent oxidoreductase